MGKKSNPIPAAADAFDTGALGRDEEHVGVAAEADTAEVPTPRTPTVRVTTHVTRDRDPADRLEWKRRRAIELGQNKA